MKDPLETEKTYLAAHRAELAKQFPEKYLLIKGEKAYRAFETYDQAVLEGVRLFGPGPFLVRSITQTRDADAPKIPALTIGAPLSANA